MLNRFVFLFGLILLSVMGTSVWAEDTEAKKDQKDPEPTLEKDIALIWGQRREVKVVQRREFVKDSKTEVAVFGSIIPNDAFVWYPITGLRVGYHFTESLMVEGSLSFAFEQQTDLSNYLVTSDIGLKRADVREFIKNYHTVSLLWSPIYGKISVLGAKLTHFDGFIGIGGGMFFTDAIEDDSNIELQPKIRAALNGILGFRWHINDLVNVRTEYRQHFFFPKATGGVSIPVELTLGAGFIF